MTSKWLSLGLAALVLGQTGSSAMVQIAVPPKASAPVRAAQPVRPPVAPSFVATRIDQLGRAFNGRVGIAVRSIDEGWSTDWNGSDLSPQQSVSKLWVAITALDAVDKGRVSLDARVNLTRS